MKNKNIDFGYGILKENFFWKAVFVDIIFMVSLFMLFIVGDLLLKNVYNQIIFDISDMAMMKLHGDPLFFTMFESSSPNISQAVNYGFIIIFFHLLVGNFYY